MALAALAGAWLYNKNSFDVLNLSATTKFVDVAQNTPEIKKDEPAKPAEPNVPVATTPAPTDNPSTTPITNSKQPEKSAELTVPTPTSAQPTVSANTYYKPTSLATALQAKASFFAERFSTFSSVRPYENITSLKDYMTDNYWQFLNGKAGSAKPVYPATGYVAKVVGTQVVALDENSGSAQINVPLVRQSFSDDTYDVGKLYSLLIKFKKINNVWLIDGAYWN